MDWRRFGWQIRALRMHRELRLEDVGARAGVSRWMVARLEAGDVEALPVGAVEKLLRALDATLDGRLRWQGTDLDRLLGAGHSALHETVARVLQEDCWEFVPELSFSEYGERGVIDIVAWHTASRTLLVIELKTEIVDVQELMGAVDRYRRLAPKLVRSRGWDPAVVATWVAVADSSTNRKRLAVHATVLRAAFPSDGRTMRAWLANPVGPIHALSFVQAGTVAERTAARGSRRRVQPKRRPRLRQT